jgi:nitrogen fixation/metabolism regulation signal transduction histidine kinase
MLLSARDDFGRIMQLQLHWRTLQRGFLVVLPIIFLAAGTAAFFAARRTARLTARPIADLARTADALAAGDLSRRAPVSGEGEVRDLVLSFNRMGEQLETSREELLRVERVAAWRDVARRIAHEIKNPLTPIRVAIHRLQSRVPESDESSRECLRSIDEEVESLGRIAASFSEFAKMPAPEPAPTDFAAITRGVVELFREAAPGVETKFEGPDTLPIVADRDQLRRAVTNLVKNAQEAVAGGGGPGGVRVTLRREGTLAVLEVEDDGPGIPEEIRETLFRPGVSAKPGGSGLGLAMVHRIATDHRGALQWREHEAGARFELRIPLDPSETVR